MEKLEAFTGTGYLSMRKTSKDFQKFFGISPLHQFIKNRYTIGPGNRIENIEAYYSGYYCCDEHFINLNGKRNYRLTLYGHILNIAVAEGIPPDRG